VSSKRILEQFNLSGIPFLSVVSNCSWSRDGRYLLSAARDWKCVLWDLKDGSRVRTVILDGPIWSADLHPDDQYDS
jgi:WD40 repeat protein